MTSAGSAPDRRGISNSNCARPKSLVFMENCVTSAAPSTRALTVAPPTAWLASFRTATCKRACLPESQVLALSNSSERTPDADLESCDAAGAGTCSSCGSAALGLARGLDSAGAGQSNYSFGGATRARENRRWYQRARSWCRGLPSGRDTSCRLLPRSNCDQKASACLPCSTRRLGSRRRCLSTAFDRVPLESLL